MEPSLFLTFLAVCSIVSGIAAACLAWLGAGRRTTRTILAGVLPTAAVIAALTVWHFVAKREFVPNPKHGFLSPLFILNFVYPYVLMNLLLNLVVAFRFGRGK